MALAPVTRREVLVPLALSGWFLAALEGCREAHAKRPLFVAAASSLRGLFEDVRSTVQGTRIDYSFEASSTLARQIAAGARFDVFVSADERSLERLKGWGRGPSRSFLGNRLALVGSRKPGAGTELPAVEHPQELGRLEGTIAIGAPEVPAGRYARAWLEARGLSFEERFVHGRNGRAVLGLVESGAADYAFVYHSDALRARKARHLWSAAPEEEPRIFYRAQVAGDAPDEAQGFLDWLVQGGLDSAARALGFTVSQG